MKSLKSKNLDTGNMSPRADIKGRKALKKIVKIDLYNNRTNEEGFDEKFTREAKKVIQFNTRSNQLQTMIG